MTSESTQSSDSVVKKKSLSYVKKQNRATTKDFLTVWYFFPLAIFNGETAIVGSCNLMLATNVTEKL